MDSFQEILAYQKLDESVVEYDYSAGILNLRGSVIPVIDFGKFLDPEIQVSTELDNKKIIISRMGANLKIGLLVDSIEDIIPYFAEDVLKVPPMGKKREGFYSGVIEKNGEEAVIIDCELLKKNPDLLNIVEGHANLFKQAEENLTQKKKFVRQTFISFKVADIFSIPIGEIREIIDIPKDIMNTPGVKPHIKGIYNLRNQIVTIVDLRTLYNMPESENPSVQKVLIVENAKEKYGLVVDDVNEIFNINAEEKFAIPLAIAAKKDGVPTHDMKELVMICNKTTNTDQKMIVLDVRSILNRIVEAA
jgi:purine-binding chemotaxis protein CheW